jgi:hypothetical protein
MFHERMRGLAGAMNIKFFFQKMVNGAVQVERKSRRSRDAEFVIDIKTPRTILK